jgi:transcriptional regulator with XRE-family HTH domain
MQTIGERLEEARKRKGISIREAAEATKIRGDYLQKFESNQFDLNLAEIYVRGFLRSYAQFLKLPAEKLVNDLNGLGLDARPKTPSREMYGRMDLSVATADEIAAAKKGGSPGTAEEPAAAETETARRAPTFNRPMGSGMPPGPMINPSLVIKGGIAVSVVVILFLVTWCSGVFSGSKSPDATGPATKSPAAAPAAPAEKSLGIIATQTVRVQVNERNPDGSDGAVLLPNTELRAGERRVVPWRKELNITASEGANVQLEVNGNRQGIGFTGYKTGWLPAP